MPSFINSDYRYLIELFTYNVLFCDYKLKSRFGWLRSHKGGPDLVELGQGDQLILAASSNMEQPYVVFSLTLIFETCETKKR